MSIAHVSLAALVVAILVSCFTELNVGILALALAWIVGVYVGGMPLNEVTDALQVFLGSQYVNDFDFNNRAYRVYVQADQRFRNDPTALAQFYARAGSGRRLPLGRGTGVGGKAPPAQRQLQ